MLNRARATAMSSAFAPPVLGAAAAAVVAILLVSSNAALWIASVAGLALAVWLAGGPRAYPPLLWVLAFYWLAIAGDLSAADLQGLSIADGLLGEDRGLAIAYSLCAMMVLALGMRIGVKAGDSAFCRRGGRDRTNRGPQTPVNLGKLLVCYAASLLFSTAISTAAWSIPTLTQPLLAFSLIHYIFLFLIAAAVFESGRGYLCLALVAGSAMAAGMIGFWASYKEPVFIILLALFSSSRKLKAEHWLVGVAGLAALVWVSLVWTAIKDEYRADIFPLAVEQRVSWLADHYLFLPIDYSRATQKLLERVGYTELFSLVLAEGSFGSLPDTDFYAAAVKHVVTPRVIFPDKAQLDDSRITETLVHWKITPGTSIGVGYVAQAFADFGFPGLLVPIGIIGVLLGLAAEYFMTRRLPWAMRQAVAAAVIFLAFRFEADIDKSLGGFVTSVIAMGLMAKFVLPEAARWLAGASAVRSPQPRPGLPST